MIDRNGHKTAPQLLSESIHEQSYSSKEVRRQASTTYSARTIEMDSCLDDVDSVLAAT